MATSTLPQPYRTGSYLIYDYGTDGKPNIRQGTKLAYRGFRASGSHQLDAPLLTSTLKSLAPSGGKLHLVDLRQETHGFYNGEAVSLYADKDWANVWRSPAWIAEDERRLVDVGATANVRMFSYTKDAEERIIPTGITELTVTDAATEETIARRMPFPVVYHRLPTTDHCPPFEMLEPFIAFCNQIDLAKDWVHFHCHGGDGRTTTFLALYDMAFWFRNWKTDRFPTLEQFAHRQCQLFNYSLNPDKDCGRKPANQDWKYELARERWFVLAFMRWYILNGLLFSKKRFVLPRDWKSKALEAQTRGERSIRAALPGNRRVARADRKTGSRESGKGKATARLRSSSSRRHR
jgi:hypothetical protein